jgi:DNA-binding CsgD family transcriptional regulator
MTEGVRSTDHAFVGRDAQLRTLVSAAAAAAAGRGSLALVGGEPGIGKTRLAEQVARQAAADGMRVHWAACWQGDGVPAFWPWMQLVRAHAREQDQAALMRELGEDAGEILQLVPDLAPRLAQRPGPPPATVALDAEEARFRLFESMAAFLRRTARAAPLLLVIDDLQWADTASLLLLRFIARELRGARLLVLGTYRDSETDTPLRQLLGSVAGSAEHMLLRGLSRPEVANLVGSLTGVVPSRDRVLSLHRRTDGNPLFLGELVRLMADTGSGDSRVPENVREVIRRRLDRLSEPSRALLATAAVLGQGFRIRLLEAIAGLSGEQLADPLEEAAAARLIEEIPGVAPRYRFTHTLVVEVIVEALGATGRQALHGRVARGLEELFRDDPEPRLAQLAHHFRLAGEWSSAVAYATRAGHRALGMLAYEAAAGHYERALEMQQDARDGDRVARCRLLLSVAYARMASGEIAVARGTYERVAALARTANAAELLARAALGVGLSTTVGIVDNLEIRLLLEALDAIGAADSVLRTRLLARLAVALHDTASPERRRALSDQAIVMARRIGDPSTLAAALLDRQVAIASQERPEHWLTVSSEVIRLARQTSNRRLEVRARSLRIGNFTELGDMDAVRIELEMCDGMMSELRVAGRSWLLPMVRSGLAVLAGRLDEAERLADLGLRHGRATQHPGIDVYYGALTGVIRYLQGRLPELEDALRRSVERFPTAPEWRCTLALALSDAGRHEEARQQFEIVAAEDFSSLSPRLPRLHSLAVLAMACDAVGDARRAELLHPLLSPHGSYCVQVGLTATGSVGSAWHYLGLVCCAMSRWDEAVGHFEAAVEVNARIGAVPFVANSRFQLARALRAAGDPSAQERAREQLDRAEETARALGLRLWRGGAAPGPAPGGPPLTPREWDVARLVADGLANGAIAERLHISKRTVETHVDHVRGKLALGSRTAIVKWMVQQR